MVQLSILSGKQAGATWAARRFPIRVGRAQDSDLRLEDHGVWDQHFRIDLNPAAGFVLQTEPDALVTINGQPVQHAVLRNGDILEIGALKLQFWLAQATQRSLRISESLVWALVLTVVLGQIALVYWLPRESVTENSVAAKRHTIHKNSLIHVPFAPFCGY
jgi:pSer/pThr/pTyr-binding forkhead associated (FHA) protein